MKLRKLGKNELSYIFKILKIKEEDKQLILNYFFLAGSCESDEYTFKQHFHKDNLQADELDKISPNIINKIRYFAITKPDENLELLSPNLYQKFSEPDNIVFFVGAGLSRLLDYPSWEELADRAIKELRDKRIINYYIEDRIRNTIKDPLQKLSIFESYFKHDSKEFKEFYSQIFKNEKSNCQDNPYDLLVCREFKAAFITTNIDTEILEALKRKDLATNISGPNDVKNLPKQPKNYRVNLDINELKTGSVAMIHGKYDEPESIVMSNFDYINSYYRKDNDKISQFLKNVFKQKTVIFIGYGLAELPILATIIDSKKITHSEKESSDKIKNQKKHYLLIESYENEKKLQDVYRTYFNNFNIEILPYHLDDEGYDRITNVLKSWRNSLRSEKEQFIKDSFTIEQFFETGANIEPVIRIIKPLENILLFNQFFTEIDKIDYFFRLQKEGFFNVEKFPPANNDSHPFYPPLFYIEKIAAKLGKSGDAQDTILHSILRIIYDVSKSFESSSFNDLNKNTIWYFIRIINHLPNAILTEKFVSEVINVWILNFSASDSNIESILNTIFIKFCTVEDISKAEMILKSFLSKIYKSKNEFIEDELNFRYLIKENKHVKVFLENSSTDFIFFLSDLVNYLRVENYPIEFKFEAKKIEYHFKAKLVTDKTFEYKLTDITNDVVIEKGDINFSYYSDENAIKRKIISLIGNYYIGDDSIVNLYYFSHWGKQSFRLSDDIFDDSIHYRKDFVIVLSQFLKRILLEQAKSKPENISTIVRSYFDREYSIPFFKQLSLPIIEVNFSYFSEFFLNTVLDENLWINNLNFGLEKSLKNFLRRNTKKLHKRHFDKINLIIQNIEKKYKTEDEDFKRKIDFDKLEWLDALKESPSFKTEYDILNSNYRLEPDYFSSMGKIKYYSGEVSPYNVEELLSFNVSELYSVITSFKQIDHFDFKNGSIRGLASSVRKIAELSPSKMIELLEYNYLVPIPYMNGIIEGIIKVMKKDERELNLKRLFEIILIYIKSSEFRTDKLMIKEYYDDFQKEWLITEIAQLIEEHLKNQTQETDSEEIIRLILLDISKYLNDLKGDTYSEKDGKQFRDYNLNYTLNSSKGKVLLSLFEFAWYISTTSKSQSIDPTVKQIFIQAFASKHRDAFIIFGTYLSQFISIDKEFSDEWIKKILKLEDEEWKCFFGGWLFFKMQHCSREIYNKLKTHFRRALDLKFYIEDFQNSGLIRSILIAYYWNYEGVRGRIFQKMLREANIEILGIILGYVCTDFYEFEEHNMLDSTRPKILALWKDLKVKSESFTEEGIEKIRFEMFELIRYWEKINQELFELLLYSIDNFKPGKPVKGLVEELKRLLDTAKETNAVYVSQLILKLTERKYCPFSEGEFGGEIYDTLENLALMQNNQIIQDTKDSCTNLIKNSNGLQKRGREILRKMNDNLQN
ncbi:SIR2 family protein [Sunxiuqinia indica]|uniref:SIR2 family protein n=1 Tax=Sunxiuqinia indica TaxID=2692584 RepID=UPI001358C06B|nr:SIR2 family protein [Sunxiuqinia indica]